jgi:hypothetical protein
MALSQERSARNESVFREANELIEERVDELVLQGGRPVFLCECDDIECRAVLRLTREEYEEVRSEPNRFVVAPGHEDEGSEVVLTTDRYQVIEKSGRAGSVAERLDPRARRP